MLVTLVDECINFNWVKTNLDRYQPTHLFYLLVKKSSQVILDLITTYCIEKRKFTSDYMFSLRC